MQEARLQISLRHIDVEVNHAQFLYDQNEKARLERYTSDMEYIRERRRMAIDRSTAQNQFNSENQFNKAIREFERARNYYNLRDEQSYNKNMTALDNKLEVLGRRRDRLLEKLRNLPV